MDKKDDTKFSKNSKTVLIVEDDESSYLFLNELIRSLNMNTLHVIDGKDAIEICKNNKIDLVLMDLKLPVLDGYKATTEIKKFKPDLPIIAQTAYALAGDDVRAIKAGCDEYIAKPLKKEVLFKMIKKYL